MAASAPPPNVSSSWISTQTSSNKGGNINGLELGMSGMSLLPSFGNESEPATVPETTAQVGEDAGSGSHHSFRKMFDSGDSINSHPSGTISPLNNSSSSVQGSFKGMSRPPGLGGMTVPSPIGKPGHSYSSSASTTQTMTLTPTSSLDGGSDPFGTGKHGSSPFYGDVTSMSSDFARRGKEEAAELSVISGLGSFDTDDSQNDGLHGLQALRERSHSSPGPVHAYSSSPPVRNQIGIPDDPRYNNPEQRRPRAVSRDGGRQIQSSRPPLSATSALSPHGDSSSLSVDRNLAAMGIPFSNNRSRDPSPPKAYEHGVISRPEMRYQYSEDPNRKRSVSSDNVHEYGVPYHQQQMDQLTNKFGSLTSFNNQMSHQRMNPQQSYQQTSHQGHQHAYQRHHHQRSTSLPGPVRGLNGQSDHYSDDGHHARGFNDYPAGNSHQGLTESDFGLQQDMRYNPHLAQGHVHHNEGHFSQHPTRSLSMTNSMGSAGSLDGAQIHLQRRSSLQSLPGQGGGYYSQNSRLPRHETPEFIPGQPRYSESTSIAGSSDEMRMYGSDHERSDYRRHSRHVSPAQSPLHSDYGGHHRHPSDIGGSTISSSPISHGSGSLRGTHGQHDMYGLGQRGTHHRMQMPDDDLAHPLVGENIEVPADDQAYIMNETLPSRPRARSAANHSGRSNNSAIDQVPSSYGGMESTHHLPTAGSSLPSPKAVYNVKFKRTQRSFAIGPRLNRDLKIGTYVKVEADRGEDLGIVIGKIPSEKYNMSNRSSFRGNGGGVEPMGMMQPPPSGMGGGANASGSTDLKRIIRLATHDEVSLLQMKRDEEEELLKICRQKVRQRSLPMNVVDAEYQFDRHKLTFFFEAEGRVDFRELVRDLFSIYKTRIWMQQLDKTTAVALPVGATPVAPVVMDYGTPIIAPASEFSEFAAMNANSAESNAQIETHQS